MNTIFKSNFSDSKIYDSLYDKLKAQQKSLEFENKYIGIPIFVYTYSNGQINKDFIKYDSINILSKQINVSRETITRYLNTNVPFNQNLFYTETITNFNTINDLIFEANKDIKLQSPRLPNKVLA